MMPRSMPMSLVCLCVALSVVEGEAATITSVIQVVGDGVTETMVSVPDTLDPNDDNTSFSFNFAQYRLRLDEVTTVDIEFGTADSGGTTEYDLFVTLDNRTDVEWLGLIAELGRGVGPQFVPSGLDGLSFDTDENDPTAERDSVVDSRSFLLLEHLDDQMEWGMGLVPSPGSDDLAFTFDLPDLDGSGAFTLRFEPVVESEPPVPEMSTVSVLAFAWLLGAVSARGRRTKRARPGG